VFIAGVHKFIKSLGAKKNVQEVGIFTAEGSTEQTRAHRGNVDRHHPGRGETLCSQLDYLLQVERTLLNVLDKEKRTPV
jgi:hypothetical protein